MSTFTSPQVDCRCPSLDNLSEDHWQGISQLAFVFARHVRHDLANVHCAVQMLEVVEQIESEGGDSIPLPQELSPASLKARMRTDLRRVVSMSHDLVLLSQAASHAAYEPTEMISLSELMTMAVFDRLDERIPHPARLEFDAPAPQLATMGDMLAAAISTFYFQWTPWLIEHRAATQARIAHGTQSIEIIIPSDDKENVGCFGKLLYGYGPAVIDRVLENALSTPTTQLAFWLAKHIIDTHGGNVRIDPNDPELAIRIQLPTA